MLLRAGMLLNTQASEVPASPRELVTLPPFIDPAGVSLPDDPNPLCVVLFADQVRIPTQRSRLPCFCISRGITALAKAGTKSAELETRRTQADWTLKNDSGFDWVSGGAHPAGLVAHAAGDRLQLEVVTTEPHVELSLGLYKSWKCSGSGTTLAGAEAHDGVCSVPSHTALCCRAAQARDTVTLRLLRTRALPRGWWKPTGVGLQVLRPRRCARAT